MLENAKLHKINHIQQHHREKLLDGVIFYTNGVIAPLNGRGTPLIFLAKSLV